MATFAQEVQSVTGLTISASGTEPTLDELSSFLVAGVIDVANRVIALKPEELPKFCATTNSQTTVAKTGTILSVVREHGSTTILRPCDPILPELRYEAANTDSLNYRSAYNPAFYELDGLIHAVPAASSGNNDIVVTQVAYDTGVGHSRNYNQGAIDNFPTDYENLVMLYASIRSFEAYMNSLDVPEDLVMNPPDWADADNWINTEEDSEMLDSRIKTINAKIAEFQAKSGNSNIDLQKETTKYQWAQSMHANLLLQYTQAFNMMGAPQQQRQRSE